MAGIQDPLNRAKKKKSKGADMTGWMAKKAQENPGQNPFDLVTHINGKKK